MISIDKLTKEVKRDEGFRDKVYQCSEGFNTIGYGWNMEAMPISERAATFILTEQLMSTFEQCQNFDWFPPLSDARQRVIVNMAFNIGVNGVSKFKKMIAAIKAKNYALAAVEMLDSKWADQVGTRANRLSAMMDEG
jgi:lysozyme